MQFEAERDVISLGEVPRVVVRAGNAGIGRFNETSKFTVTNPDGSKNEGPCDTAREPGTSAGFAALNFKCHPFTQIGVYIIRFEPASSGLSGDPVELRLRVVKEVPKTPPAPAGWQAVALTSGLPQSDCYSYGESYVAAFDHARLVKGKGPGTATIPSPLAGRMSMEHARAVKYVFEANDGWVVMFDHGEFGGGIEWYARVGGEPRSVFVGPSPEQDDFVPQNVNRALAADGVIYVLQGLAHMGTSEGQLVKIWREHDHFSSHVIARYASEPVDWIRRDDGSWFVATWNAIWETREGVPSTVVARLPEVMSYPTSLLFAADGTFFVGTRGGFVRLTPSWPDAPRYAADFLWEAGSQKRDCRPNDEAAECLSPRSPDYRRCPHGSRGSAASTPVETSQGPRFQIEGTAVLGRIFAVESAVSNSASPRGFEHFGTSGKSRISRHFPGEADSPDTVSRAAKYAKSGEAITRSDHQIASFVAGDSPLLRLVERAGQASRASLPELGIELERLCRPRAVQA